MFLGAGEQDAVLHCTVLYCTVLQVSRTLRAEFVEEAVIAPLVLLCGDLAEDAELSRDDLTDLFDNQLIEEDVLPLMQMAM